MTLNVTETYPSSYLKAHDLPEGRDVAWTIREVSKEQFANQTEKLVVGFDQSSKELPLNKTNAMILLELYSNDAEQWVGKAVSLYRTHVSFQGRTVETIRIRPKAPKTAPEIGDDDIPF